ncbi:MAG: carB, partial [Phycisphaerales bacterium]|nr:carB [Phycisphaerales bacterium]
KRFGFGLDKYDKWLNASRGMGGPPMSSGENLGQAAQATGLPSMARGNNSAADNSDKTTQGESLDHEWPIPADKLRRKLAVPSQGRLYYVRYAMKMGWTIEQIHELTNIDPWFLGQMQQLVEFEVELSAARTMMRAAISLAQVPPWRDPNDDVGKREGELLRRAKQLGYSDVQLAEVWGLNVRELRTLRLRLGVYPVFKLVDTCAAEFEAATPYYYSSYEAPFLQLHARGAGHETFTEDEVKRTDRPKVLIIGGGPNRIGQGIEFDYCCVQAAFAMKELGYESVMINSNPETVSTDYDTSDLLFFEPLTHEDILNICERLNGGPFVGSAPRTDAPETVRNADPTKRHATSNQQPATSNLVKGVIVQFGGQTPLNLARGLQEAGVPIIGTSVDSLDAAGDREQFRTLLQQLGLKQPANGIARSVAEAREIARKIGYPVLVRPSFVLGGRAMEIVSDESQLNYYMANAVEASTIADARFW